MNKLAFFDNIIRVLTEYKVKETTICFIALLCIILLTTLKWVLFNKKGILEIVLTIATLVFGLLVISREALTIVKVFIIILLILILAYSIYDFVITTKIILIKKTKVQDHLKNSEFEYFVQVGRNNKIIDFSANVLILSNRNKNDVLNLKFPEFLFDCMNVTSVNNSEFTLNTLPEFRNQFLETVSKLKNYEFCFTIKNELNQDVRYDGLVQPVYLGKKLVCKNIYISLNKNELLAKTKDALIEAKNDITDVRNQLYVAMSLTNGVVMYFDFLTKSYVATECFMKFTNTHQAEYDFEEFLRMIHPEDIQFYLDQTATINSLATTRLKFRMKFNDKYYNIIEDSINLNKDDKLVSIIRVSNTEIKEEKEVVLSTQETNDILDELKDINIDEMTSTTLNLFNKGNKNE